jgi:hypothetical protein
MISLRTLLVILPFAAMASGWAPYVRSFIYVPGHHAAVGIDIEGARFTPVSVTTSDGLLLKGLVSEP